jgi:hypothetical protein
MRIRNLGLYGALVIALMPAPAQAQGDFMKSQLRELIEKSGVYVSTSSRTAIDNDVQMEPSFGIGYGTAGNKRTGIKYPFSISGFRGGLETNDGVGFGQFKSRSIMSGVGYQWVRGKMVYGAQLGLGYSFNKVELDPGVALAFGVPEPVGVTVSNSFVVQPKLKAEYFLHTKVSVRTQLSYTYTDPDVVIHSAVQDFAREWTPHHFQLGLAMGFFPFRKP